MAGKDKKDAGSGVTPVLTGEAVQFQPAPPGALEALAAQLQAGYGGGQQANMDYLNNLYRPMNLPMPRQYDPANPAPGAGGTGNGALDQLVGTIRERLSPLDVILDPLRDAFNKR